MMSSIGKALNHWLGAEHTQHMRQLSHCEQFSKDTIDQMLEVTETSADEAKEMGSVIHRNHTLGRTFIGGRYEIKIPRPSETKDSSMDAIGNFHTHPMGDHDPSAPDILEMMKEDDTLICIGRGGYRMTRVSCFTPPYGHSPEAIRWKEVDGKQTDLNRRILAYNREMRELYPDKRGFLLRHHIRWHDKENFRRLQDLEQEKHRLLHDAEGLSDARLPRVCHWERPVETTIHGIPSEERGIE